MKPGTLVGGRFEIERLAGTGGMARVYRAKDRVTGGPVALKVLLEERGDHVDRFIRETEALAELTHPVIVRHVAHGRAEDGRLFLAMEWVEGETLASCLKKGSLGPNDGVDLVRRIAEGLGAAHARGYVHRDVKPSNLLLEGGDLRRPKLLDFGIAHALRSSREAVTRTGSLIGTPGYMSPEQARGQRGIDARADVFSLGCVLFECLTGRPPFVGESFMAVLAKILVEDVPRASDLLPSIPPALDDVIARMLAKDPDGRQRDARAVVADLDALGDVGSAALGPMSIEAPASLTGGELRLLTIVIGGGQGGPASTPSGTALLKTADQNPGTIADLRSEAQRHGGNLERVLGGTLVATFGARGAATDQVAQAARCALRMQALLPDTPFAIATGRGLLGVAWPVGEAIDRAAVMLRDGESAGIRLDETTAGLLDDRFQVGGDASGLTLVAEREGDVGARRLLGREIPCVGRERELAQLERVFDECAGEPVARAMLVTAPPGVGKSRLRYELVRLVQARAEHVEVWVARGDPMGAGSAFGLLGQALRGAAGIRAGEPIEVRRRKLRARVARHVRPSDVPRVTEFLGEIAAVPFHDADAPVSSGPARSATLQLRAARDDARLMGDQMRRAFEEFIAAECAAQPVLVVVEDLQWGDLPTVQFLDAALRQAADLPLCVLALGRPEVRDLFPRLWEDRGIVTLSLRELKRAAAEKLVRSVLGDGAPAATVDGLLDRAAGNAFYLEELLRAVVDGKASALPETVLAMVEVRLEALETEARQVLRAASVFGQVFWSRGVAVLLGGGEGREAATDTWLEELTAREIVQRRRDGRFPDQPEYVFRSALVREAAYAMLTEQDRPVGHRLAGGWLRDAGETDPAVLAEHFERGGVVDEAIRAYAAAAEQALEGNDLRAAIARAERGAACGAVDEALGDLRLVQAEAHAWLGQHVEAASHAAEAASLLPAGSARGLSACAILAEAAGRLSDVDRVADVAHALSRAPREAAAYAPFACAAAHAVSALLSGGRDAQADVLLAEVERLHPEVEATDPVALAWILSARSWRRMMSGDLGACITLDTRVAACFEAVGDLRRACEQRAFVGYDMLNLGAYPEAEAELREAAALADRMGLRSIGATARHNLGLALARCGHYAAAVEAEGQAIEAYAAQRDRRMEGGARVYLSLIHQSGGRYDLAEEEARAAVELLEVAPPLRVFGRAVLALARFSRGKYDDALAMAIEANEELDARVTIGEGEPLTRLVHVEALLATGDRASAAAAVQRARRRVVEMSQKIGDFGWRSSFLSRIPENARILALAAELGG